MRVASLVRYAAKVKGRRLRARRQRRTRCAHRACRERSRKWKKGSGCAKTAHYAPAAQRWSMRARPPRTRCALNATGRSSQKAVGVIRAGFVWMGRSLRLVVQRPIRFVIHVILGFGMTRTIKRTLVRLVIRFVLLGRKYRSHRMSRVAQRTRQSVKITQFRTTYLPASKPAYLVVVAKNPEKSLLMWATANNNLKLRI